MKPIEDGVATKKKGKQLKKEYLIIAILLAVIVAIFLSGSNVLSLFKSAQLAEQNYESILENKLENLLCEVDGVGKVKVMISTDGGTQSVVLKEVSEDYSNGSKSTEETVILVGGKPYVTKTCNPNIVGVAVVCQGADNLSVKMTITEIITTTLSVNADCVRIIKMK
ncbi:MAG: hypothetical protein IJA97_05495 [Clostridia bacterium]|nr:hypothetical protein [Clostridia bacterium]